MKNKKVDYSKLTVEEIEKYLVELFYGKEGKEPARKINIWPPMTDVQEKELIKAMQEDSKRLLTDKD